MEGYPGTPSAHSYWCYDPHGYQPNVSLQFNTNISVHTPSPHPSFDIYNSSSNNNSSRFAESGYLSRTPTPPTPVRVPSPSSVPIKRELDNYNTDSNNFEPSAADGKPRLPYVKRTRIQYTMQQLQTLEEAFQNNHYPEVTTVDALAELLDVRHEKISIWFQNRRSRFKRQQKPKSAAMTNDLMKKVTHSHSMLPYEPSPANYYSPYLWPSPVVDNRASMPWTHGSHSSSPLYDHTTSPMWHSSSNNYSNSSSWHQAFPSTMALSSMSQGPPLLDYNDNTSCSSLSPPPQSSITTHYPTM